MAKKGQKIAVFWPWRVEFWPFFHNFCKSLLSMHKKIILKNQKNSFTRKILSSKNCENGQKRAKNGRFLTLEGRILTLFSQFFCKSLLNMPKNIILKNQKNSFTRKISKSKKLQTWPKKGHKFSFFGPGGPNFDPFFTIFANHF